jgi:hypothetical protein
MLVMIGPTWASVAGQQGRRLEQAADFVRTEVATALPRKDVLVIPVLLRGATIPAAEELPENLQALHRRNAFELSDTRWEYDIKRLGDALAKLPGLRTHRSNWRVLAAGGIALLAVVLFFLLYRGKRPFPSPVPTGKWAVVFGGDTTRQAAEDEINKAIKLQVPGLAIYHRENSYRSAAVFDSKEKATSMLAILKKLRPSAYVPPVSVDSWCKNAQEKDNSKGYVFYECSS